MLATALAVTTHAHKTSTAITVVWYAVLGAGTTTLVVVFLVKQIRSRPRSQAGETPERPLDIRLTNVVVDDDLVLLGYTKDDVVSRIRSTLGLEDPKMINTMLVHVGSDAEATVPVLNRWEHDQVKLDLRLLGDQTSIELVDRETADGIALDHLPCPT
ncbi:MAG: hypothetical protein E6G14_15795 [Actinobacteria bacterium]|nr:MAG: hypothetical protein E6G14_15795 [Actinomycetota bacterium]